MSAYACAFKRSIWIHDTTCIVFLVVTFRLFVQTIVISYFSLTLIKHSLYSKIIENHIRQS